MPQFVLLWTDAVLWALVAVAALYFGHVARRLALTRMRQPYQTSAASIR